MTDFLLVSGPLDIAFAIRFLLEPAGEIQILRTTRAKQAALGQTRTVFAFPRPCSKET